MTVNDKWRRSFWDAIGRGLTAHVVMMRDVTILDDATAAAMLGAIDSVQRGDPPKIDGSLALVAGFDDRFDSLSAPQIAGSSRIARGRHDLAAMAQRLLLRDRALDLAEAQIAAREALIEQAEGHVFTLMPAWSGSALLQPTNLAHFLTGAIAPLGRSARRLHQTYEDLDRSALGAGSLAGPGLPIDRDETSDLLGCEGPVLSTFDALSAVDHLVAAANSAEDSVAPLRSVLSELLLWQRTEPNAIQFREELLAPLDANLPHFRPASAIERAIAEMRQVGELALYVSLSASGLPYGPTGEQSDHAASLAVQTLELSARGCEVFAILISGPIEINRAWLARNAGRGLITTGDLADFLMVEEGIDPASARSIAAMTAQRAAQDGLEASGITPQLIDSAALLAIGRELGIEIERLGAWLAPRRFIEKRAVLGGPAAPAIREVLGQERERLAEDQRWLDGKRRRIAFANENLAIRTQEILSAGLEG
jgi:argininosuccinate lyase